MVRSEWGMSTNLHKAFDSVLNVAVAQNVPQAEMPEYILILSDMQFNCCSHYDDSAIEMIERKYRNAGYEVPKVVFWNLHASGNTPVSFDKNGTALVSGFSPAVMKAILSGKEFTPRGIMLAAVDIERYNVL
jgi:hypothetical protein